VGLPKSIEMLRPLGFVDDDPGQKSRDQGERAPITLFCAQHLIAVVAEQ
jgi:hypothetical protein